MPSCSKLRRLVEWALASIITGDGATAAGLPTPEEVAPAIPLCAKIRPTWGTRPYGRPTCQSEKAASGLPAAAPSKVRHISAATPWPWGVSSLPPPGGTLLPLLERLPERPMASVLIDALNFTYSRSHAFRFGRKKTNPTSVRIEFATSTLRGVQVTY